MSWSENTAHNWAIVAVPLMPASTSTITVTTTADTLDADSSSIASLLAGLLLGTPVSLRDAITAADNTVSAAPITIDFDIPGSGTQTINLLSALPTITDSVTIDATSQPGYAGTPLIQLQGTSNPYNGLNIAANNVTVKGLAIYDFSAGNGIQITSASGTVIQADYIGLTANNTAGANDMGVVLTDAMNSVIGGTTAAQRNVISGNTYGGMRLESSSSNNVVEGNYIGLDAAGTAARANGLDGILVTGAPNNTIGGVAPGAGNVISGNSGPGIEITGAASTGNVVVGNYIGTNAAGTAALGNSGDGVEIDSGASSNMISGPAGAGNIISGNAGDGIFISGGNDNQIDGNYIGTDVTGTVALANADEGIEIYLGTGNTVGGTGAGAGNVISGNGQLGIWLLGTTGVNTSSNLVEGNYIGTDVTGMVALRNGYGGIEITDANANTIGGTASGAGNVISGNSNNGIALESSSTSNLVEGNYIGTAADGVTALGNTGAGVEINTGASNNTIGGTAAGQANIIACNAGIGVEVLSSTATGDSIEGNSIYGNTALGIDLGGDGVTPNHTGVATGPNDLQNYPVLATAAVNGTNLSVAGAFSSLPTSSYTIDFYWSPLGDPSSHGQAQTYIGSANVTTDTLGNANINATFTGVSLPAGVPAGAVVTATATDSLGNTSEFALNVAATQPPTVATPASATPNPVTGTTAALSVLGAEAGGESSLTYTWATTGSPPAPVLFSANGTNAAKDVTATFTAAGTYDFQATITDAGGLSTTSTVSVTVNPTLTSIAIQPGPAAMADNTTYPFSATGLDQFGNPLASQPAFTWSVDDGGAGGTINSSGLYSAPASTTGTDMIRATSGSISAAVSVTVTGDGIFSGGLDIGTPGLPGYFSYNAGTYSVSGGYGPTTSDEFQFANSSITGNSTLVAEVTNVNGTATQAEAGVLLRNNTGGLSPFAATLLLTGDEVAFYYRTSTGAAIQAVMVSGVQAPQWVEIVRHGNTFRSYYSADGVTWTQVGSSVTFAAPERNAGRSGGVVYQRGNALHRHVHECWIGDAGHRDRGRRRAQPGGRNEHRRLRARRVFRRGIQPDLHMVHHGYATRCRYLCRQWRQQRKEHDRHVYQGGKLRPPGDCERRRPQRHQQRRCDRRSNPDQHYRQSRRGDPERERHPAVLRHGLRPVRQRVGHAAVVHLALASGVGSVNASGLYRRRAIRAPQASARPAGRSAAQAPPP